MHFQAVHMHMLCMHPNVHNMHRNVLRGGAAQRTALWHAACRHAPAPPQVTNLTLHGLWVQYCI